MTKRTEAEADWHIIDTLHKLAKAFDVHNVESEKLIQSYRTPLDISIIERAVKQGAAFSSEYVLQYTKDLAELVRKEAKREAADIIKVLSAMVKERVSKDVQTINDRLAQESEKLVLLQEQARLENHAREKINRLWAIWEEESECPMHIDTEWFKSKKKSGGSRTETRPRPAGGAADAESRNQYRTRTAASRLNQTLLHFV